VGKLIDARTNDALWVFMISPLYTTAVILGILRQQWERIWKGGAGVVTAKHWKRIR
jgi:hypothetical protein